MIPQLRQCLLCIILTLSASAALGESKLSQVSDALCAETPGNCEALRSWCNSPDSGSDNPGACVLINFVKTLSNQALCRKDPEPKECLAFQASHDAGLQKAIAEIYNIPEAREVVELCINKNILPASELGLNAEKQALLEQALNQFEEEFTIPLRMYDSSVVLDCMQARL